MAARLSAPSRGVLRPLTPRGHFHVGRFVPPAALAPFVEYFWTVAWDLRGHEPHEQSTLPFPSVHVVLEVSRSEVVGVVTKKFTRKLEGRGRVFGTKFHPGGFSSFIREDVSRFTDRRLPVRELFDMTSDELTRLEGLVTFSGDEDRMVDGVSEMWLARCPEPDPRAEAIRKLVEWASGDRNVTRVEELSERLGETTRTLQRLFKRYVGVSPKWVIQRFRLHEAAERLAAGAPLDCARLAAELGYADQAHLIRDFRRLVGLTPAAYARTCRSPSREG